MELKIENLSAKYADKMVLSKISLSVKGGEFICLCGPNGSGKSTLLGLCCGIEKSNLKRNEKSIFYDKTEVSKLKRDEIAKKASLMVQNETCVWNYSVFDFISLGRFVYGDGEKDTGKNEVLSVMKKLGIEEFSERKVKTLSGGELQKARIARCLAQKTSLLLLDEPISGLDFKFQSELLLLLKKLCKKENLAVLISMHDLNLASIWADKIMLLSGINDENDDTTKSLTNQPLITQPFFFGKASDVIKPENLQKVYGTKFGIFEHPAFHCPQVWWE